MNMLCKLSAFKGAIWIRKGNRKPVAQETLCVKRYQSTFRDTQQISQEAQHSAAGSGRAKGELYFLSLSL